MSRWGAPKANTRAPRRAGCPLSLLGWPSNESPGVQHNGASFCSERRRLVLGGAAAAGLAAGLAACGTAPVAPGTTTEGPPPVQPAGPLPPEFTPPASPREFRAAWVASVANIDWPSRPGLPNTAWRAEAIAMLDRAQTIGLNAIVLQIRPAADALYASGIEPWSEYLTGAQGRAPVPADDPLALWVDQAHRRGIELHAWFNPYRARHSSARTPLAPSHIALARAHAVKRYGDLDWMDPAEPDAAAQTLAVVTDVVRRYDIDGVHIDDYFYPYPVSVPPGVGGVEQPFPDEESYARYRLGGGQLARDDWRRANVDALVQQIYSTVHLIKPWVRVGISPFGVGKPERRPAGVVGFSQYDKLYADVERWLGAGWLDYLAPQLYWQINREGLQFPLLLDHWVTENTQGRHLWPGLFTSLVTKGEPATSAGPRVWPAREITEQIQLQRQRGARAGGHIHFSMAALMQDRDGLATQLQNGLYAQAALVPATPWLVDAAPGSPTALGSAGAPARSGVSGVSGVSGAAGVSSASSAAGPPAAPLLRRQGDRITIEAAPGPGPARWSVWLRTGGQWRFSVLPGAQRSLDLPVGTDRVAVSAINRVGAASAQHLLNVSSR